MTLQVCCLELQLIQAQSDLSDAQREKASSLLQTEELQSQLDQFKVKSSISSTCCRFQKFSCEVLEMMLKFYVLRWSTQRQVEVCNLLVKQVGKENEECQARAIKRRPFH